jgi:hypothetical protein
MRQGGIHTSKYATASAEATMKAVLCMSLRTVAWGCRHHVNAAAPALTPTSRVPADPPISSADIDPEALAERFSAEILKSVSLDTITVDANSIYCSPAGHVPHNAIRVPWDCSARICAFGKCTALHLEVALGGEVRCPMLSGCKNPRECTASTSPDTATQAALRQLQHENVVISSASTLTEPVLRIDERNTLQSGRFCGSGIGTENKSNWRLSSTCRRAT